MGEFLRVWTKNVDKFITKIGNKLGDIWEVIDRHVNWYVFFGLALWILAVYFHEKQMNRLKVLSFALGMMFLSIAAIKMWVRIDLAFMTML